MSPTDPGALQGQPDSGRERDLALRNTDPDVDTPLGIREVSSTMMPEAWSYQKPTVRDNAAGKMVSHTPKRSAVR